MLAATVFPSPEQWAEFEELSALDMLRLAHALVDKLALQVDDFCDALVEAHLPTHESSKAQVNSLLKKIGSAPAS